MQCKIFGNKTSIQKSGIEVPKTFEKIGTEAAKTFNKMHFKLAKTIRVKF